MKRNIDGTCSTACRNPDIRTINTMGADTAGNFEIRAGNSVSITTETNGIRIAYTGGITTYDNTDGNLVIDNNLFTIDLADDVVIAGDLTVNGTYYTVHAEHVYTEDDYIIMRDGAVTGLGSGDFSGFQVKLYDGVNDGRLVIDDSGTARVGDVGDEQPLLTRDEAADLTDGQSLVWDAANSKAITRLTKPMIMAYKGITGTPFSNTITKIGLSDYVTNDTDQDYFSFTNSEITVKKSGLYRINYQIYGTPSGATRVQASYGVNSEYEKGYMINYIGSGGSNLGVGGEDVVFLNANDIVFLTAWLSSPSVTFSISTATTNHLEIEYLG